MIFVKVFIKIMMNLIKPELKLFPDIAIDTGLKLYYYIVYDGNILLFKGGFVFI
jgi:hypothetical protein